MITHTERSRCDPDPRLRRAPPALACAAQWIRTEAGRCTLAGRTDRTCVQLAAGWAWLAVQLHSRTSMGMFCGRPEGHALRQAGRDSQSRRQRTGPKTVWLRATLPCRLPPSNTAGAVPTRHYCENCFIVNSDENLIAQGDPPAMGGTAEDSHDRNEYPLIIDDVICSISRDLKIPTVVPSFASSVGQSWPPLPARSPEECGSGSEQPSRDLAA